jgi:hypothetical protein
MPDDDVDSNSLTESKSRADRLAERFLEDRARRAGRPQPRISGCFLCGRSYSTQPSEGDDSIRFCGAKCREAYDAGAMPERDVNPFAPGPWHVIAGPPPGHMANGTRLGKHGCFVNCLHCKREFESKGLRCCSVECERGLKDRAETVAMLAEVGGTLIVEKRKCEVCGGDIPKYVGIGKQRRLTNKTKTTCSPRCQAKARKMGLSEGSNCGLEGSGPSQPSDPIFGPSTPPLNLVGGYRWPDVPDVDLTQRGVAFDEAAE